MMVVRLFYRAIIEMRYYWSLKSVYTILLMPNLDRQIAYHY